MSICIGMSQSCLICELSAAARQSSGEKSAESFLAVALEVLGDEHVDDGVGDRVCVSERANDQIDG